MAEAFVGRLARYARMEFNPRVGRRFRDRSNPLETLRAEEIRDRYRFYPESIILLLGEIFGELDSATRRSSPLPPLLMLLVTLQYFATGAHHLLIAEIHGVSRASVGRVVDRVTAALCRLLNRYVSIPTTGEDITKCKREFFQVSGFPNVVGCIDCTHIRIKAPTINEPDFVNRKGFHSLNVQMVCDAQFKVLDISAKWPGSTHDSRVFRESRLCARFENGSIDGLLLGDSGYGCKRYLMTPYLHPQTDSQTRYNNSLCKTRVIIEQTFGIMKRRFACLSYGIRTNEHKACQTTIACTVLHNFGLANGDMFARQTDPPADMPDVPEQAQDVSGFRFRDIICNTFIAN